MRAANETRTRDPDLGKVVLYQLSYFRKIIESCCGERDRTTDLQVMSLASYHCSTPRYAVRTGLEPVTPCVTGMYSNQLN